MLSAAASKRKSKLSAKNEKANNTNVVRLIRIKPPNKEEKEKGTPYQLLERGATVGFGINGLSNPNGAETPASTRARERKIEFDGKSYKFDAIFDQDTTQEDVFEVIGGIPITCVRGDYSVAIYSYGQTGSGKTHTMYGEVSKSEEGTIIREGLGITPRLLEAVFDEINGLRTDEGTNVMVKASFFQIYNDVVYDLLGKTENDREKKLKVREAESKFFVENLTTYEVGGFDQAMDFLRKGIGNLTVSSTKMNCQSSRSHSIFVLTITKTIVGYDGTEKLVESKLTMVDLAGSEREASLVHQKEANHINTSLSHLKNMISPQVGSAKTVHRDCTLTKLLCDTILGNCINCIIGTISTSDSCKAVSTTTLKFLQEAINDTKEVVPNKPAASTRHKLGGHKVQGLRHQKSRSDSDALAKKNEDSLKAKLDEKEEELRFKNAEVARLTAELEASKEKAARDITSAAAVAAAANAAKRQAEVERTKREEEIERMENEATQALTDLQKQLNAAEDKAKEEKHLLAKQAESEKRQIKEDLWRLREKYEALQDQLGRKDTEIENLKGQADMVEEQLALTVAERDAFEVEKDAAFAQRDAALAARDDALVRVENLLGDNAPLDARLNADETANSAQGNELVNDDDGIDVFNSGEESAYSKSDKSAEEEQSSRSSEPESSSDDNGSFPPSPGGDEDDDETQSSQLSESESSSDVSSEYEEEDSNDDGSSQNRQSTNDVALEPDPDYNVQTIQRNVLKAVKQMNEIICERISDGDVDPQEVSLLLDSIDQTKQKLHSLGIETEENDDEDEVTRVESRIEIRTLSVLLPMAVAALKNLIRSAINGHVDLSVAFPKFLRHLMRCAEGNDDRVAPGRLLKRIETQGTDRYLQLLTTLSHFSIFLKVTKLVTMEEIFLHLKEEGDLQESALELYRRKFGDCPKGEFKSMSVFKYIMRMLCCFLPDSDGLELEVELVKLLLNIKEFLTDASCTTTKGNFTSVRSAMLRGHYASGESSDIDGNPVQADDEPFLGKHDRVARMGRRSLSEVSFAMLMGDYIERKKFPQEFLQKQGGFFVSVLRLSCDSMGKDHGLFEAQFMFGDGDRQTAESLNERYDAENQDLVRFENAVFKRMTNASSGEKTRTRSISSPSAIESFVKLANLFLSEDESAGNL